MKDWMKPENRYHSLVLAAAITLILVLTFCHGCASSRVCQMVLVGQPNGDSVVEYHC